jgi:hypothetical protein
MGRQRPRSDVVALVKDWCKTVAKEPVWVDVLEEFVGPGVLSFALAAAGRCCVIAEAWSSGLI